MCSPSSGFWKGSSDNTLICAVASFYSLCNSRSNLSLEREFTECRAAEQWSRKSCLSGWQVGLQHSCKWNFARRRLSDGKVDSTESKHRELTLLLDSFLREWEQQKLREIPSSLVPLLPRNQPVPSAGTEQPFPKALNSEVSRPTLSEETPSRINLELFIGSWFLVIALEPNMQRMQAHPFSHVAA